MSGQGTIHRPTAPASIAPAPNAAGHWLCSGVIAVSETGPNVKHVQVNVPVPRDPDRYRATIHFGQRAKSRLPDDKRDRIIRECIEDGWCRAATRKFGDGEHEGVKQFYQFQKEIADREWRVVVGIRPDAILEEDERHLAVTVMEVGDDAE